MTDTVSDLRSGHSPAPNILVIGGTPASTRLRNVGRVTDEMLDHVVRNGTACRTLPSEEMRGDVSAITRNCVEFLSSFVDGHSPEPGERRVHEAAARWAREGIPIAAVHHAMHEGAKFLLNQLTARGNVADRDAVGEIGRRLVEMLASLSTAVSASYLREFASAASEQRSAVRTLVSALLGGNHNSALARECGIEIAGEYTVLAIGFPRLPDDERSSDAVGSRRPARVEAELERHGAGVLALLGADGGTVLVPPPLDDSRIKSLIGQVAAATGIGILAAAVDAVTSDLVVAAEHAHDLLDLLKGMRRDPGVYRFTDFVVEYQLSRPGLGREILRSLLDPLEPHPELMETLDTYFAQDLNRKRAARQLHIHPNTLQYRFKRIAGLTGFDPCSYSGAHYLHAARMAQHAARANSLSDDNSAPPAGVTRLRT